MLLKGMGLVELVVMVEVVLLQGYFVLEYLLFQVELRMQILGQKLYSEKCHQLRGAHRQNSKLPLQGWYLFLRYGMHF